MNQNKGNVTTLLNKGKKVVFKKYFNFDEKVNLKLGTNTQIPNDIILKDYLDKKNEKFKALMKMIN